MGVIKRGQTLRHAAVNRMLRAIEGLANQDAHDAKYNAKHPEDIRVLFSGGDGVSAALEVILDRCNFMKAP